MKVIGYCWAVEQVDEEMSDTDEGKKLIEQYAKLRRWHAPVQLEDRDEAFADFDLRQRGGDVMKLLRPGDILVVPDQSYLFRTASQGLAILRKMRERRVSVHSIDLRADIANGKLFDLINSVLEPLSVFEPELTRERVRARKRRERSNGRYLGGNPPFGFSVTPKGQLQADGSRQRVIRHIAKLKAQGMSLRKISSELGKKGVKISHVGVASLLKSIGYAERSRK